VVTSPLDHYSLTRLYEQVTHTAYLAHARGAPSLARAFGLPVRWTNRHFQQGGETGWSAPGWSAPGTPDEGVTSLIWDEAIALRGFTLDEDSPARAGPKFGRQARLTTRPWSPP